MGQRGRHWLEGWSYPARKGRAGPEMRRDAIAGAFVCRRRDPPPAQDPPLPPQQKTAQPCSPGSRPWPQQVLGGPWSARGPQGLGFPNLGLPSSGLGLPSSGPHSCPCAPPGLSRLAPGNSPLQSPSAWMGIGLSCAPDRATYFLTPLFILLTSKISRRGENDPKRSEVCRDS